MLPPIVVDTGPDVPPAAIESLLEACTASNNLTRCVSGNDHDSEDAFAIAIVTTQATSIHVEVAFVEDVQRRWYQRTLRFDESDPATERYRTAGLAIGTLVGTYHPGAESNEDVGGQPTLRSEVTAPPDSSGATVAESQSRTTTVPAASSHPTIVFAGLGLLLGPGLNETSALRYGATLQGGITLGIWHAALAVDYSASQQSVASLSVSWFAPALEVGVSLLQRPSANVRLGVGTSIRRIGATAFEGEAHDERSLWNLGGRFSVDATYWAMPQLGVWLGGRGTVFSQATRVFVDDQAVGTSPRLEYLGFVGVSWRLGPG